MIVHDQHNRPCSPTVGQKSFHEPCLKQLMVDIPRRAAPIEPCVWHAVGKTRVWQWTLYDCSNLNMYHQVPWAWHKSMYITYKTINKNTWLIYYHIFSIRVKMSRVLRKLGLMHVRKVSSQISLWIRYYGIFRLKKVASQQKIQWRRNVSSLTSLCGLHMLILDDTLRTCIKPPFHRTRLNYL